MRGALQLAKLMRIAARSKGLSFFKGTRVGGWLKALKNTLLRPQHVQVVDGPKHVAHTACHVGEEHAELVERIPRPPVDMGKKGHPFCSYRC